MVLEVNVVCFVGGSVVGVPFLDGLYYPQIQLEEQCSRTRGGSLSKGSERLRDWELVG